MQEFKATDVNTKTLIKGMLLFRDVSLTKLAEELNKHFGYTFTQSNLSRKLNSNTVKWTELKDIAKLLGYNIKIFPSQNWNGIENDPTSNISTTL